jgi:CarD family transcriptional regulator
MQFRIGQKVTYPNLGVCSIENIETKTVGKTSIEFYSMKFLANDSLVYVPKANAEIVRLRPVINSVQCEKVLTFIAEDFEDFSNDWKVRTREFNEKIQGGEIFGVADVLKKLTYQNKLKQLSFRESRILDKARFLVVSELAFVCSQPECNIETKIDQLLKIAFEKHDLGKF